MTIKQRIHGYLFMQDAPRTATQICRSLTGTKLESISGILKRMAAAGEIVRIEGIGPRGGYGYKLP